jgi:hypothetical protein
MSFHIYADGIHYIQWFDGIEKVIVYMLSNPTHSLHRIKNGNQKRKTTL